MSTADGWSSFRLNQDGENRAVVVPSHDSLLLLEDGRPRHVPRLAQHVRRPAALPSLHLNSADFLSQDVK